MKYIYLIIFCSCLISCRKEKPSRLSYEEQVAQGLIEKKTSNITINDSLSYTLKFVREKEYEGRNCCAGLLELEQDGFNTATGFLKGYDYTKIYEVILFFGDLDLCEGEIPSIKDAKAYLVYYSDKENYLTADYINPSDGTKESHRVRDTFCDAVSHYLFDESGIKSKPAVISVTNTDYDKSKTKVIPKSRDKLYKKATKNK